MGGFPHAIIIGLVAFLIAFMGIVLRNRSWILASMLLSLTTASPMFTFTRGAAGAIVPSDMVALVLLLGLFFGGFNEMSSFVVPKWRRPFVILSVVYILSVLLVSSWNMPGLAEIAAARVTRAIPFLPLNVQITIFRLFRVVLLMAFFLTISKLIIDDRALHQIFLLAWIVTICLATAQVLTRFGIVNLQLSTTLFWEWGRGTWVLGYTKSAGNRLLFVGFFVTLILAYKSVVFKGLYIASAVLVAVSLLLSGSRAGILGLVVGMMVLSFRCKMKFLPFVLISMIVLGLAGFLIVRQYMPEALETYRIFLPGAYEERTVYRAEIAIWTFRYLIENPVVIFRGSGFMNFFYAVQAEGGVHEHAHNDFLTSVTEVGIAGLVIFLWWLASLGIALWRAGRKAIGRERWISACINAGFWGLLSVMFFETTFFPAGGSLSLNRFEIILFGSLTAYYIQRHAAEQEIPYYDDYTYEEFESQQEIYV